MKSGVRAKLCAVLLSAFGATVLVTCLKTPWFGLLPLYLLILGGSGYGVSMIVDPLIVDAQAKIKTEQASLAKSAFLANMSHELRTPLSGIQMYTEIVLEDLEEDPLQFQNVADLKKVLASGDLLVSLVDDILDLAKVETGKMELFYEETTVQSLLEEVLLQAEPLMEKNRNTFILRTQDGALTESLVTDKRRVKQILLNLISNAAKFTKEGRIILATSLTEAAITFKLSDTGIGMTEEQSKRVWLEFEQASETISRRYGGTGLGLALTKKFTEALQGNVQLHSIYGVGTTFTVKLPRLRRSHGENSTC